jgi:hypothetical protein
MQNLIELSEVELDAVAGIANFSLMVTASRLTRPELFSGNAPLQLRLPSRQLLLRSARAVQYCFPL